MQIHVNKNGQQIGPYALEQVNQYLEQGSLLPTDPAWHEGLAGWVPLNQVEGVGPGASAPPPFDPDAFGASPPPPGTPSPEPNQPPSASSPPVAMGSICPQCSVAVQPGQVVCMNCGSHLHAMPTAGKKGAGKLIAIIATIGGSVLILALLAAGLFFFGIGGDLLGGPGRAVKKAWHYNSQSLPNDALSLEALAGEGDANAQYKLALILLEGSRQDPEAMGWLLIAESRGHKLAAEKFKSQIPKAWIGTQTAANEALIKNAGKLRDSLLKKYPKANGSRW